MMTDGWRDWRGEEMGSGMFIPFRAEEGRIMVSSIKFCRNCTHSTDVASTVIYIITNSVERKKCE